MYFGSGEIFPFSMSGVTSFLDSALIAKVIEDGEGLVFTADVIDRMISKHPDFAARVTQHLISEVDIMMMRELLRSSISPEYKVCNFLYLFSACYPTPGYTQVFTHAEIASVVGLSRVQVSRVISKLRADGVIESKRHSITIKDMDELIRRCSQAMR